jgi:hypothetical protein
MTHRTLKKLWAHLLKKEQRSEGEVVSNRPPARVDPLTVGLRIDLSVLSGAGKEIAASQFVWVSPTRGTRSTRALRVLLLPN